MQEEQTYCFQKSEKLFPSALISFACLSLCPVVSDELSQSGSCQLRSDDSVSPIKR